MEKIINKNNEISTLILNEKEDEDILFAYSKPKEKKSTDKIFQNHANEGGFEMLINRHLINNELKFREFFQINRE